MTRPHDDAAAFVPVSSVDAIVAAAAREGASLVAVSPAFDDTGLDFRVVHARDDDGAPWIVRTPRRFDVVAAMRVEARVLAFVAPRLPVAVPSWRVHADDVVAYPRLSGEPVVALGADGPAWRFPDPTAPPDAFVGSLVDVLVALDALDPADAARAGVPTTTIDAVRAELARDADATRSLLAPSAATWARWQALLADDDLWPPRVALVHGDLHPGHLLVDDAGRLTGVLDWTEAKVTDPAVDLAMIHGCFGPAVVADVLARCAARGARVDDHAARRAAARWDAFPVVGAAYALRTGSDAALAHARAMVAAAG